MPMTRVARADSSHLEPYCGAAGQRARLGNADLAAEALHLW